MNAVSRFGSHLAGVARRWVPEPFVIAILLSVVVLLFGAVLGRLSLLQLFDSYATGMSSRGLLAFAFQMALILSTGYALAEARGVRSFLQKLADLPSSQRSATWMVAFCSMLLALFNWGLGLVAGAFLAREAGRSLKRRGLPVNYGLLGAAGYMGLLVWHGGLSGSAPLKEASGGFLGRAIPVSTTLFSGLNIAVCLSLLLLIPLFLMSLFDGAASSDGDAALEQEDVEEGNENEGWDNGIWLTILLVIPLGFYLVRLVVAKGSAAIGLNSIILLFLLLGLVFHKRPLTYARAFGEGARSSAGILLQFPLYFGIMAVAKDSGMLVLIAKGFEYLATAFNSLLGVSTVNHLATFTSSAVLNLFVPSGGGQWVIQAPVVAQLAKATKTPLNTLVMAFAYGDQLTNMLQPFWALPLLSITGLKARDILGYTLLVMLVAAAIIMFWLCIL